MFKFNNDHIFTGYLKQLLASFNLPKCKVYTAEQRAHAENYNKNLAEIVEKQSELLTTKQNLQASKTIVARELANIEAELAELEEKVSKTEEDEARQSFLQACKPSYLVEYASIVEERLPRIEAQLLELAPELNVIQTNYHSTYERYPNTVVEDEDFPLKVDYPERMRYIPYIKDGYLQEYTKDGWHYCHSTFDLDHGKFHKVKNNSYVTMNYSYGQKILNYTKNLEIRNTVYDSYTHEYLGDYLRFHRDFANINLMPLYNCFSNRACPHLDFEVPVGNTYSAKFKTDQSFESTLYKYYMVPVKFFKNYTIAIDSMEDIEVCCCLYDTYYNEGTSGAEFSNIPKLTYQCLSSMQFSKPILYTKLQNLNSILLNPDDTSDLCQHEDELKLILKIPANNKSSIVILEGDYTKYNDSIARATSTTTYTTRLDENGNEVQDETTIYHKILKEVNKTVINYEEPRACEFLADKLITPLQLLRMNTGESYPFADRLVEYLVGNAITLQETIEDNVIRAKKVISKNCNPEICSVDESNGVWEPVLQCLIYDYINEYQNLNDVNHDILGFVDKDVEKWYAVILNGKAAPTTIASIDLYNDNNKTAVARDK